MEGRKRESSVEPESERAEVASGASVPALAPDCSLGEGEESRVRGRVHTSYVHRAKNDRRQGDLFAKVSCGGMDVYPPGLGNRALTTFIRVRLW